MSGDYAIRPMTGADHPWVLALNRAFETELSPLDGTGLERLVANAALAATVTPEAAFLIAFDQNADYDSPNFHWFRSRFPRFLYVDRIAVSADHGRRGLGGLLYDHVFATAAERDYPVICAEVNSEPPNPGSDAFHAARGFRIAGTAHLGDRDKTVRYLVHDRQKPA